MAKATDVANLPTYRTWKPTGFDTPGLGLEERQDWLVGPCSRNRDSEALTRSNWDVFERELDAVDPTGYEVHRFGHWANGWFEIVLVKPDSKAYERACELACFLADYPILDESHYSNLLCEEGIDE
jgi:hypothetical protein